MNHLDDKQEATIEKFFDVLKELSDNDVALTYNTSTGTIGFVNEKLVRFFVAPEQICDYPEATDITQYITEGFDLKSDDVAFYDSDGLHAVLNEKEGELSWKWLRTEGAEVLTPEQFSSAMDQLYMME